jgi:hypothetical protein
MLITYNVYLHDLPISVHVFLSNISEAFSLLARYCSMLEVGSQTRIPQTGALPLYVHSTLGCDQWTTPAIQSNAQRYVARYFYCTS